MAVTDEMLTIAEDIRPPHCCLVPEKREELTTEGGLDVAGQISRLREAVGRLQATGARVSLFIDPDERQLDAAAEVGAPVVEIHTGRYADAVDRDTAHKEYLRIVQAARHAERLGLIVHGGHGLNYHNVQPVAAIPQMRELNIGHAIVSEAIWVGLAEAVAKMKRLMKDARRT
jgi:pyridoxine 5-phosphate synthase